MLYAIGGRIDAVVQTTLSRLSGCCMAKLVSSPFPFGTRRGLLNTEPKAGGPVCDVKGAD